MDEVNAKPWYQGSTAMLRIVRVGSESMSSPTLQDGDFIVALCCRAHRSVREELGQALGDAPRILQEHQVIHSG
jgi:hypothetical protein